LNTHIFLIGFDLCVIRESPLDAMSGGASLRKLETRYKYVAELSSSPYSSRNALRGSKPQPILKALSGWNRRWQV
jgi:hypothetical protein